MHSFIRQCQWDFFLLMCICICICVKPRLVKWARLKRKAGGPNAQQLKQLLEGIVLGQVRLVEWSSGCLNAQCTIAHIDMANAAIHKFANAQMHKCSTAQLLEWQMHKCSNAHILICQTLQFANAQTTPRCQMHKCSCPNAYMPKYGNATMLQCSNGQMIKLC